MIDHSEHSQALVQWEALVNSELRYRGYTVGQIAALVGGRKHTDLCELGDRGWDCTDEEGDSLHPEHDEADEIAGIIGRAFGWI